MTNKAVSKALAKLRRDLRQALADYMWSEGDACGQGGDHDEHAAVLAKLLNVPIYSDRSGYDFYRYRKPKKNVN